MFLHLCVYCTLIYSRRKNLFQHEVCWILAVNVVTMVLYILQTKNLSIRRTKVTLETLVFRVHLVSQKDVVTCVGLWITECIQQIGGVAISLTAMASVEFVNWLRYKDHKCSSDHLSNGSVPNSFMHMWFNHGLVMCGQSLKDNLTGHS